MVGAVEKAKSLRDMVVPKTLANFLDRKTQLYEQGATVRRIGLYVRCWWRWVRAGVEIRQVSIDCLQRLPHKPSFKAIPSRINTPRVPVDHGHDLWLSFPF